MEGVAEKNMKMQSDFQKILEMIEKNNCISESALSEIAGMCSSIKPFNGDVRNEPMINPRPENEGPSIIGSLWYQISKMESNNSYLAQIKEHLNSLVGN